MISLMTVHVLHANDGYTYALTDYYTAAGRYPRPEMPQKGSLGSLTV
jgi:hypothetical protein